MNVYFLKIGHNTSPSGYGFPTNEYNVCAKTLEEAISIAKEYILSKYETMEIYEVKKVASRLIVKD